MDQDTPSQGGAPSSQPPPPTGAPGALRPEERTMAMLAHLLAIFTWFLGPLIIWLTQKETSAFVDDQGKEALNFQITVGIGYIALGIVTCLTLGLGIILLPIVGIINLIFCILACVAANKGERYRYPFAIRLIT